MTTDKNKQNKQCTRCMETLPLEAFYFSTQGYTAKCRTCTIEYNTERRALGPRTRPRKVPQVDVHRKLLSARGPENRVFLGRYIHGYKKFCLYCHPQGLVLDGELLYGHHSIDDILYVLSTRHMKLMSESESGEFESDMLGSITSVRNACGVPIDVRFVKSLVSLDQYFLWMDKPRKLLISEVSQQVSLSEDILRFIYQPEKNDCNRKIVPPGNLKNSSDISPQVYEFTEE